jgi:alpha-D-ribose 1-methylphosphonate 5-triphosphate synthase subunit PhnG
MPESAADSLDQATCLSILARAPAGAVKAFAEELIPDLGPIEVLQNRTGLVMIPMSESVKGATFYVGEALIAEARVRVGDHEGYAACLGRDLHQALAIALIDAARSATPSHVPITRFVTALGSELAAAEDELMRQVEATRVEMETF